MDHYLRIGNSLDSKLNFFNQIYLKKKMPLKFKTHKQLNTKHIFLDLQKEKNINWI